MANRGGLCVAVAATSMLLAVMSGQNASAQQDWPNKAVKVLVPFPPGGSADILGRVLAQQLTDGLKQPFVIENRGGAGGVIGSQQVARAEPDGYTLVVSSGGSHVVAPATMAKSYEPMKDFSHIAMLGGQAGVLIVNSSLPVSTVKEFLEYAKGRPSGVSWASPGQGTHNHLVGELFKSIAKANMEHISYKGAGPAVADLLGNQIQAAFVALSTVGQHLKSRRLRALAVASEKRSVNYPDVATFAESGYPQLVSTSWFGLSGPSGVPPSIVIRLNEEVRRALGNPSVREKLAHEAIETRDMDPETFTRFVKSEIDFWTPYVKALSREKQ